MIRNFNIIEVFKLLHEVFGIVWLEEKNLKVRKYGTLKEAGDERKERMLKKYRSGEQTREDWLENMNAEKWHLGNIEFRVKTNIGIMLFYL